MMRTTMRYFKRFINDQPAIKTICGFVLLVLGVIALLTPLTPGAWLILIGLELLGWRIVLSDRITQKKKQYF